MVTLSSDNIIRQYSDVKTSEQLPIPDLSLQLDDKAYTLAMHPTGWFMVLGFGKHIQLYHLLAERISLTHTVKLDTYATDIILEYSTGGAYFAASCNGTIIIFDSYNLVKLKTISSPQSASNVALHWSRDDRHVGVASETGELKVYDTETLKNVPDGGGHIPGSRYTSAALDWGIKWDNETVDPCDLTDTTEQHQSSSAGSGEASVFARRSNSSKGGNPTKTNTVTVSQRTTSRGKGKKTKIECPRRYVACGQLTTSNGKKINFLKVRTICIIYVCFFVEVCAFVCMF